jgi:DNA-binding Lrp family transcriptional regulator
MDLDTLDKKILWHLDYDARVPFTELAQTLGISKQGLNSRLNKLTEAQLISGYYAIIDTHRLGLLTYRVYLRLNSTNPKSSEKLIKQLCNHQLTLFVGTLSGSWDLEVVFTARNFIHFNELLKELSEPFSELVHRSNISMTPVVYALRRDYLLEDSRKPNLEPSYGFEPDHSKWDETDFQILGRLAVAGRTNYDELGRECGVTNHTAKNRVLRLEEEKVIRGYRANISAASLGRGYVKALISLAPMNRKQTLSFYTACAKSSFVVYLTEVLGSWQLEIEAEVTRLTELDELVRGLRTRFPHLIIDYDIVTVLAIKKLNYLPGGSATIELRRQP